MLEVSTLGLIYPIEVAVYVSCFGIGCLYNRAREERQKPGPPHMHMHNCTCTCACTCTLQHAHAHMHMHMHMHMCMSCYTSCAHVHVHAHMLCMLLHHVHVHVHAHAHVHVHVASRLVSDRRSSPWAYLFLFHTPFFPYSFLVYPPLAFETYISNVRGERFSKAENDTTQTQNGPLDALLDPQLPGRRRAHGRRRRALRRVHAARPGRR